MASESDTNGNAILRSLLELAGGEESGQLAGGSAGVNSENVAQLLAAAIAQVGQSILAGSGQAATVQQEEEEGRGAAVEVVPQPQTSNTCAQLQPTIPITTANQTPSIEEIAVNPLGAVSSASGDAVFDLREAYESVPQASTLNVATTVEVPSGNEKRPLCVKFPLELRRRIIAMRKSGKHCKDIAKELKVSVSGVQKVWERFLSTGMAHDRKPSSYAGRPRKSTYSSQDVYSPGVEFQSSDEVFQASQVDFVTTPTSATPTSATGSIPPNSEVIIADVNEVYTEGATVEIVETSPLPTSKQNVLKKKGAPAYRSRLLLRLVEGCPLATLRAMPDSATNPHVQNLMLSIAKPLYMEYVLGHPFGKVPPSRPFDGCTSTEAEVILSDPASPVAKKLLAALGYSTKVYFNACCNCSPLFDQEKILSSLPLSLGPSYLAESIQRVVQLLIDYCVNPEVALELLPTAPGPLIVAKRGGDTVVASHSIPIPTKLSEFWTHLYSYTSLLQCCENFVSALPPSAPCLLCHPFESFAQTLEIYEPIEESPLSPSPTTPFTSTSLSSHTHLNPDLHHESSEVEVQVLESGTSGLTVAVPLSLQLQRGRGKGRKQTKPNEKQPQQQQLTLDNPYNEQNVESDGEFEIPIVQEPGSEVIVSHSEILGLDSEQVKASEAAENLALLATQVTSMEVKTPSLPQSTNTLQNVRLGHGHPLTVSLMEGTSSSSSLTPLKQCSIPLSRSSDHLTAAHSTSVFSSREENVTSSEIVAVAEVEGTVVEKESDVTPCSDVLTSKKVTVEGVATQTEPQVSTITTDSGLIFALSRTTSPSTTSSTTTISIATSTSNTTASTTSSTSNASESLRRSRRKVTRSKRLLSPSSSLLAQPNESPRTVDSQITTRSSMTRRKAAQIDLGGSPTIDEAQTSSKNSSLPSSEVAEEIEISEPLAKRTRSSSKAAVKMLEDMGRSPSDGDEGVAFDSGWGHPTKWGVEEVGQFITRIPQCSVLKDVFVEHLVDGETLLSLDPQMMVKLMDIKTGPALRIHRKIASLKKRFSLSNN